jgi:membrane-associated protein
MSDLGQLIAYWGYPAIFVVVVLGNVGLPVPEEITLIVAGYLVWQGYFRLSIVLAVGVISAVAADNIGYWLGRRYGPAAVARVARWAAVNAERMESMRRFMLRHGALACSSAGVPGVCAWTPSWAAAFPESARYTGGREVAL